jgi:hypothetical protein
MLQRLPTQAFGKLKGPEIVNASSVGTDREEQAFLTVMAGQAEFRSHVAQGWRAPVDAAESAARMTAWLTQDLE